MKLRFGKEYIIRKKRTWYPGAIYHLMGRGNHRNNIFREDMDYQYFLMLLKEIMKDYPFQLHSYCLMTNHYHMLLETGSWEIWRIMKCLIQSYTAYYNKKYQVTGHLFQGRYKSCLVEDDAYFLQVSRYIHLNPVKAQMVACPEDYVWSSYETFLGRKEQKIVTQERILSHFTHPRRQAYQNFVEDISVNRYEDQIQNEMGEDRLWLPW